MRAALDRAELALEVAAEGHEDRAGVEQPVLVEAVGVDERRGAGSGGARRPACAGSPSGCGRRSGCRESSFGTCSSRRALERGAARPCLRPIECSWAVRESRSQRSSFSRIRRTARYEPPRAQSALVAGEDQLRGGPRRCSASRRRSRAARARRPPRRRLRVEGFASAKRWKQDWAQRPSSRPLVRRMMSRSAWWVIIAWSDWTSEQQVAVGADGVEVVAREGGHAAERLGPLAASPKRSSNSDAPSAIVIVSRPSSRSLEAQLARVRGRQRRVRDRVEPVRVALGEPPRSGR